MQLLIELWRRIFKTRSAKELITSLDRIGPNFNGFSTWPHVRKLIVMSIRPLADRRLLSQLKRNRGEDKFVIGVVIGVLQGLLSIGASEAELYQYKVMLKVAQGLDEKLS